MRNAERFIAARDLLLRYREDLAAARAAFHWPRFEEFNWARDYFDVIAADNHNPALRVVSLAGAEETLSFAQLARRSAQVANFLAGQGAGRQSARTARQTGLHGAAVTRLSGGVGRSGRQGLRRR